MDTTDYPNSFSHPCNPWFNNALLGLFVQQILYEHGWTGCTGFQIFKTRSNIFDDIDRSADEILILKILLIHVYCREWQQSTNQLAVKR